MKPGNYSASIGTKLIRTAGLLTCLILSLFASLGLAQQTAAPKRILKLYWYDQDRSVTFHQSFQAALQLAPAGTVEYYPEYLESNRFPGENQSLLLHDYLRQKYADRTIDVVVASPDAPLNFLLRYRGDLFPTAPLVFSSVRRPSGDELAAGAGATGVIQLNTHRQTLDLALRLHPETKQVLIIGGTLEHTKLETEAREALQGYENKVRFTYLTDLTPDELIAKTKSLPERSIILYIWQQSVNKNGKLLESADLLALIAQSASVPIYGLAFTSVGYGIIGGYVSSTEAIATRVAEIALRIANGERAQDIPIESAPAVPTFDWRQLQRWGISEDKLPPGSIVRFKEVTFWEHYKWHIIGVLALCALQALLISILLIERAHRRRAKASLDERLRFETLLSELSADLMGLPAFEINRGIDEGLKRLGRFLGVRDGAFLELSKSDVGVSQDESHWAVLGTLPLAGIPDEQRRWCMGQLRSGETVNFSSVAELPPEELSGGRSNGRTGVKSLLAIPIAANGSACALTFARGESHRNWPEDLIPRLRLAGEILVGAVVRKKHEEALRSSEERYRNVVETQTELICRYECDTTLTFVNDAYCRFFGKTRGQLIGMKFLELIPEEARPTAIAHVNSLLADPRIETDEHQVIKPDGTIGWQEWVDYAIRDTDGTIVGMQAIGRDITERKRLERELEGREREFSTLVENSPDIISRLDRNLRYVYVSPMVERALGLSPRQFIGKTTREIGAPPHDWEAFETSCRRALETGEIVDREFSYAGRHYHSRLIPEVGASGLVDSLLCISEDITERRRSERELVQLSVRMLGLQEEERSRIGRQLHDVTAQNLFATTINLARLQSNGASSDSKEVLAECQALCEQALQEIRTLSYLLHPPILDQAGLTSALRWYIDGFSKRSGIDVGLVITEEFDRLPREMEADLFRIVQESLSNVHRHSGSNTARIRLEKQTAQVVLQIRDEGQGIQSRATPGEADEATLGVGIPSMRQRLRQLGGHLTIESNSQGTAITATVPLRAERRQASRAAPA